MRSSSRMRSGVGFVMHRQIWFRERDVFGERERFLAIPNKSNTHASFGAWSPVHAQVLSASTGICPVPPKRGTGRERDVSGGPG